MEDKLMRVLLIEDNPEDARLVQERLLDDPRAAVQVEWVDQLPKALNRLSQKEVDVILSAVYLLAGHGVEVVQELHNAFPKIPIVALTAGTGDEALVTAALQKGARDCLCKTDAAAVLLRHVLLQAIERNRAEQELIATRKELTHKLFELARANEALKEMQLALIQTEKMKSVGQLAAGVAHEIKNPLTMLLQAVEYLSRQFASGHPPEAGLSLEDNPYEIRLILGDMKQWLQRADSIVRGLVNFSTLEKLTLEAADLNTVVETSLSLVKHELEKRRIRVEKELGQNLPPVKFDRIKLEQVFVNLYMNAIQAMPEKGTLTVRTLTRKVTPLGPHAAYRKAGRFHVGDTLVAAVVEDTGRGILEENLSRIFDPFFTTKPAGQGTGLGLSVSRKIVDLHGGIIEVANRKEGGVRAALLLKAEKDSRLL